MELKKLSAVCRWPAQPAWGAQAEYIRTGLEFNSFWDNINKILLNYMPKDHDVSSFNQTYGNENLKKWLITKSVKLTD